MTQLLPDIFAIEVPEDAKDCKIKNGSYCKWIIVDGKKHVPLNDNRHFRVLFTTKSCSEEQAGSVVERIHAGGFGRSGEEWKIYDDRVVAPRYATESLQSLLRSHNLTGKNYLLIKKQQQ